jgi:hypothetical protein
MREKLTYRKDKYPCREYNVYPTHLIYRLFPGLFQKKLKTILRKKFHFEKDGKNILLRSKYVTFHLRIKKKCITIDAYNVIKITNAEHLLASLVKAIERSIGKVNIYSKSYQ